MARKYRLEPEGNSLYRVISVRDFKTYQGHNPQVKGNTAVDWLPEPTTCPTRGTVLD